MNKTAAITINITATIYTEPKRTITRNELMLILDHLWNMTYSESGATRKEVISYLESFPLTLRQVKQILKFTDDYNFGVEAPDGPYSSPRNFADYFFSEQSAF